MNGDLVDTDYAAFLLVLVSGGVLGEPFAQFYLKHRAHRLALECRRVPQW